MSFEIRQLIIFLRPFIRHLAISRGETPQRYTVLPDTAF